MSIRRRLLGLQWLAERFWNDFEAWLLPKIYSNDDLATLKRTGAWQSELLVFWICLRLSNLLWLIDPEGDLTYALAPIPGVARVASLRSLARRVVVHVGSAVVSGMIWMMSHVADRLEGVRRYGKLP